MMKYKVIKFGAPWCGPCRALETKLKGFDKCEIVRYDVDDADTDLLAEYKIRSVPVTILLDDNGNEIHRWVGLFNVDELHKKIDEA